MENANFKYFKLDDFKCKCCGENKIGDKFVSWLDAAREEAGVPFVVLSGYRCKNHNKSVDGRSDSAHLYGVAADIKANSSHTRYRIVRSLLSVGFQRIGIYPTFIHVDMDMAKPQKVAWLD